MKIISRPSVYAAWPASLAAEIRQFKNSIQRFRHYLWRKLLTADLQALHLKADAIGGPGPNPISYSDTWCIFSTVRLCLHANGDLTSRSFICMLLHVLMWPFIDILLSFYSYIHFIYVILYHVKCLWVLRKMITQKFSNLCIFMYSR